MLECVQCSRLSKNAERRSPCVCGSKKFWRLRKPIGKRTDVAAYRCQCCGRLWHQTPHWDCSCRGHIYDCLERAPAMVVIGKPTALPPTTTVQVIHIVNLMDAIDWENVDAVRRFFNAVSRNFPPDWTGCEVIENDLRIAEHKHSMLTPDELTRGVTV